MNNLLQLKGRFEKRKNSPGFGPSKLPAKQSVSVGHIRQLIKELSDIKEYWKSNLDIKGAIISVHYKRVVAKSNRLRILLSDTGKSAVSSIRGAKFVTEKNESGQNIQKHVFTHYVQLSAIDRAIDNLEKTAFIIENFFRGEITTENTESIGKMKKFPYDGIAKSTFINVILDAYYVERFDIDICKKDVTENTIVTIYRTDVDTKQLLAKFGINILDTRIIDGTTILLSPGEMQLLYNKAPYLIAMSVTDFTKIRLEDVLEEDLSDNTERMIPAPGNEPTVGVIDTHFDTNVYFSDWVEYHNMLPEEIELERRDYYHGTAVSSIIVDGPKGNPNLDDGCGRFKVRHFGVATHSGFSSFAILRNIRSIVSSNRDIKVWNLSLGSPEEIKETFISPEAAELDRIQNEFDVIFIVAGTNTPDGLSHPEMRIGAPADSLNALVVNAVDSRGKSASYSRKGPVLSFFHKPDISYFGGDGYRPEEKIAVCINDLGAIYQTGTSFAAPWIARKMAYLIHIMGLNREVAKALIIDAAASWKGSNSITDTIGYGIVPRRIEDILNTPEDEIKFVMSGTTEDYETYTYNLPVPVVNGKHPFYSKATLVYFPGCDRNQGVDYTSTEMDIQFGRVYLENMTSKIKPIDDNRQTDSGTAVYEEEARNIYRKWDNVKHICEEMKTRAVPRKSYDAGMWGISIFTKERMSSSNRKAMPFGLVITLKEMHGKNRLDDFVKMCMTRGWLVNRLDVKNQIDVYSLAEEEIEFE
ncbi:MAG: S8 family peptidase [Coprococcus sp.]